MAAKRKSPDIGKVGIQCYEKPVLRAYAFPNSGIDSAG
jgi:hypothetical protein